MLNQQLDILTCCHFLVHFRLFCSYRIKIIVQKLLCVNVGISLVLTEKPWVDLCFNGTFFFTWTQEQQQNEQSQRLWGWQWGWDPAQRAVPVPGSLQIPGHSTFLPLWQDAALPNVSPSSPLLPLAFKGILFSSRLHFAFHQFLLQGVIAR